MLINKDLGNFKLAMFPPQGLTVVCSVTCNRAEIILKSKNNNCFFFLFFFYMKVVDHYENPKNVGNLDKQSRNVGTGLVGAPACGDVMKLQVSLAHLPKMILCI